MASRVTLWPLAPSHYQNQSWHTRNWTLINKLQWKFNQNNIFIQGFKIIVTKMVVIFFSGLKVLTFMLSNCFSFHLRDRLMELCRTFTHWCIVIFCGSPLTFPKFQYCVFETNLIIRCYKSCSFVVETLVFEVSYSLQWRHIQHDGVSNHQPHDCSLNCFFKLQIKENIKAPHHWLLWGNSPVTAEFPAQRASNAENVSIWWHHVHGFYMN